MLQVSVKIFAGRIPAKYKELLSDFDEILVREDYGADIVRISDVLKWSAILPSSHCGRVG